MEKCAVIIVAAGSSKRAGFDKLMAPLGGQPVLLRTVEAFAGCPAICEIVLVTPEERFRVIEPLIKQFSPLPIHRVDGGKERQFSVAAGLSALTTGAEWVAVHDGARPLITAGQISLCLEAAAATGAASSAHPIVETLKRRDEDGYSGEAIDREGLWAMETPQVFFRRMLTEAYSKVLEDGCIVTDEVSAMEYSGYRTMLVENASPNPKITRAGDLALAEAIYQSRQR